MVVTMKKMILNAILISLAIVLSIAERWLPLEIIVPIPGIKLGLANIVTMFALCFLDIPSVLAILFIRCSLASLLIGSITAFAFSVTGGFLAFLVMLLLKAKFQKWVSMIGISIAGAAFHNIGQILAACVLMRSFSMFAYLPLLLVASVVTGFITGSVLKEFIKRVSNIKLFSNYLEPVEVKK